MLLQLLKAKLHRATVTGADLHYEGSIGIDSDLLKASGMLPFEKVDIYNVTNGERFSTYIIEAEAGSGTICLNGAAARKVCLGDILIITTFVQMDEKEAENFKPKVVLLDKNNKVT